MATNIATLNIAIKANTNQMVAGFNQASQKVQRFSMRVNQTSSLIGGKMVGALGAAAAGALSLRVAIGGVSKSLQRLDDLAKTGRRLGIDPNQLQSIRIAASELSGMDVGAVDTSLQRMTRRLAEAAEGGGAARDAIISLGLSADNLAQMSPDKAFAKIAKAMEGVDNQTKAVQVAFDLFGREGVGLVTTLQEGGGVVDRYRKSLEDLGMVMSTEQLTAVETANDAIGRLNLAFQGIVDQVTASLAPAIITTARVFIDAIPGADGMSGAIESFGKTIETVLPSAISIVNILASRLEFLGGVAIRVFAETVGRIDGTRKELVGIANALISDSFTRFDDAISGRTSDQVRRTLEAVKLELKNAAPKTAGPLIEPFEMQADAAVDAANVAIGQQKRIQQSIRMSSQSASVGAATRRTAAGFSAVQQAKDTARRMAEVATALKQQMDELRQQTLLQGETAENTGEMADFVTGLQVQGL